VTTENPGVIIRTGDRNSASNEKADPLPPGSVRTTVRPEKAGAGFWLDVKAGPITKTGLFKGPLSIPEGAGQLPQAARGMLDVTLIVVDSSITISPADLELDQISIASAGQSAKQVGILSLRKLFGSFKVASVTSSVPELRFDVTSLVPNKNYLIRIKVDRSKGLTEGAVVSSIVIATDDPNHQKIEVPFKMLVVP